MSKHTPGPWVIERDLGHTFIIAEAGGMCADLGVSSPSQDDNARLIAAAPELLEALKTLLAYHGETGHGTFRSTEGNLVKERECLQCTAARAAIAKAEGREDE
jgi:16S rRNA C1402 N4-methylase RsmH